MATFITRPAVIAAGESLSDVVDCSDMGTAALCAIVMPQDWNSSGGITFQVSHDTTTYCDLYHMDGREVTITATPGGTVLVDADVAKAVRFLKLRAGTEQNPVAQNEDREFGVVLVSDATAPVRSTGAKASAARRGKSQKTGKVRRKHR
jgi:hypothetical protein